jgi:hypothetical protein
MEDVNVPHPNPFITQWLVSAECRALMFERGEIAEALYREAVSKRTGRLAASTHVATEVEGDRWVSMLTAYAPYAASQEYGAGDHPGSTHRHHQEASHTLNEVLDLMGTL